MADPVALLFGAYWFLLPGFEQSELYSGVAESFFGSMATAERWSVVALQLALLAVELAWARFVTEPHGSSGTGAGGAAGSKAHGTPQLRGRTPPASPRDVGAFMQRQQHIRKVLTEQGYISPRLSPASGLTHVHVPPQPLHVTGEPLSARRSPRGSLSVSTDRSHYAAHGGSGHGQQQPGSARARRDSLHHASGNGDRFSPLPPLDLPPPAANDTEDEAAAKMRAIRNARAGSDGNLALRGIGGGAGAMQQQQSSSAAATKQPSSATHRTTRSVRMSDGHSGLLAPPSPSWVKPNVPPLQLPTATPPPAAATAAGAATVAGAGAAKISPGRVAVPALNLAAVAAAAPASGSPRTPWGDAAHAHASPSHGATTAPGNSTSGPAALAAVLAASNLAPASAQVNSSTGLGSGRARPAVPPLVLPVPPLQLQAGTSPAPLHTPTPGSALSTASSVSLQSTDSSSGGSPPIGPSRWSPPRAVVSASHPTAGSTASTTSASVAAIAAGHGTAAAPGGPMEPKHSPRVSDANLSLNSDRIIGGGSGSGSAHHPHPSPLQQQMASSHSAHTTPHHVREHSGSGNALKVSPRDASLPPLHHGPHSQKISDAATGTGLPSARGSVGPSPRQQQMLLQQQLIAAATSDVTGGSKPSPRVHLPSLPEQTQLRATVTAPDGARSTLALAAQRPGWMAAVALVALTCLFGVPTAYGGLLCVLSAVDAMPARIVIAVQCVVLLSAYKFGLSHAVTLARHSSPYLKTLANEQRAAATCVVRAAFVCVATWLFYGAGYPLHVFTLWQCLFACQVLSAA